MNRIRPLRYWVHKVLPLVYDDSLSYYELLNKIVDKLNEVIEYTESFNAELKEYVDEWLNSHPEATTTVMDGSLTLPKFSDSLKDVTIKRFRGYSTGDFARTMVSNVAMSYILKRNEFAYGDARDMFHGDGAKVNNKYQICCSTFVMAVINGIDFEHSRYNGIDNEINGYGFCDSELIDFFESDTDKPEEYWRFSHHLAKWLDERGYCFEPENDLSNVQTGDIVFFNYEGGGTDPTNGYKDINHSSVFRCIENDNFFSVWEVGTIPTLAKYPFSFLERSPCVLVARPPYKNYEEGIVVKNMERFDTYPTSETAPIWAIDTFKKGLVYTVDFDSRYEYDEAHNVQYHYPAIVQPDNTTLDNQYGASKIKNHYTLFVTPTVDCDSLILATRSSESGLDNTGEFSNIVVVEGFHPNVRYAEPYVNALYEPASGEFETTYSKYSKSGWVHVSIDVFNGTFYANNAYNLGSIVGVSRPLLAEPINCIALTAEKSAYPAVAWLTSTGQIIAEHRNENISITEFAVSVTLPGTLRRYSS